MFFPSWLDSAIREPHGITPSKTSPKLANTYGIRSCVRATKKSLLQWLRN